MLRPSIGANPVSRGTTAAWYFRRFSISRRAEQNSQQYENFAFTIHSSCTTVAPTLATTVQARSDATSVKSIPTTLGKARVGRIKTPHGHVDTPNFVFCATKAAAKAITMEQIRAEGAQFVLSNTYHLMLTPGSDIIQQMGGLQKFTAWNGPMLTDSGGYQIFSMGHGSVSSEIKGKRGAGSDGREEREYSLNKDQTKVKVKEKDKKNTQDAQTAVQTLLGINEHGATFRSYVDGSIHNLTPERSIHIQKQLGADLIVVLDECTPFNVTKEYTEKSMHRSHRWAIRSLEEFTRTDDGKQALYGIVQGTSCRTYVLSCLSCLVMSCYA